MPTQTRTNQTSYYITVDDENGVWQDPSAILMGITWQVAIAEHMNWWGIEGQIISETPSEDGMSGVMEVEGRITWGDYYRNRMRIKATIIPDGESAGLFIT